MEGLKVVILGYGKVGSALAYAIEHSHHDVLQIYNRSSIVSEEFQSRWVDSMEKVTMEADIYIVSIPDDEIENFIKFFSLGEHQILAHTAGNRSIDILKGRAIHYGVFYPFQSFTEGIGIDFKSVPLLIDGESEETLSSLSALAEALSSFVLPMPYESRKKLQLSGVFVNNFVNAIYAEVNSRLIQENIDPRLVIPLINYTTEKLQYRVPLALQTGPALRRDEETISSHKTMLANDELMLSIYESLSQLIYRQHPL